MHAALQGCHGVSRMRSTCPETLCRLTAVLALRGLSVRAFAAKCGFSNGHVRAVVQGLRAPSERLRLAMEEELSAKEWRFVRGEIDTLTVARGAKRTA